MSLSRFLLGLGMIGAATVLAATARAGTQTYVTLAGSDDGIPKLGMPGIAVTIDASALPDGAALKNELARELAELVHTRRLAKDEAGDYDLEVTLKTPRGDGRETTVPFEAELRSAQGRRLWRVEGRSEVEGAPVNDSVLAGIGRNVVSALIHDGWVQPRYDPDNPPPQPPTVRLR
jgi:hypothetical protein